MKIAKAFDVGRALDALNRRLRKVPGTIKKHPIITAGIVGTGAGLANIEDKARNTEGLIMREQIKAPGAKYAGQHKKTASYALSNFEKKLYKQSEAGVGDLFTTSVGKGLGAATASEGVNALKSLIHNIKLKAKDKAIQDPQRRKIIAELTQQDPIVSEYEQINPGGAQQAFSTMQRWAPELSTDANVVRSFLRQAAQTGGTVDYPALKALTDAELSALRARKER